VLFVGLSAGIAQHLGQNEAEAWPQGKAFAFVEFCLCVMQSFYSSLIVTLVSEWRFFF
jgi:hypothetical protein